MIAEDYVRMVAFELRDLPWRMRRDLVSGLRGHLDELPPGTDLGERLGRPHEYAAEMRAAAGLERRRGLIAFLRARRPRNVILTVVVLTVIGLAIGAVEWIDSYQPLAFANLQQFPAGYVDSPTGDSASVVYRQGAPFRFGLEIHNTGRFTVRVLGVQYGVPPEPHEPFKARLLVYGPSSTDAYVGASYRPFHPFDLRPGWRVVLILKGVYAECGAWRGEHGSQVLFDFPVRYSFLWRTATAEVPLPEELAIVFRKNSCR